LAECTREGNDIDIAAVYQLLTEVARQVGEIAQ
jgi:hypothetical protein